MNSRTLSVIAALALAVPLSAGAAIPAEEAKQLGTTLTAVGAERAANPDGSIPEYTGGLTKLPAGGTRADPFAGEKPLLSIDAKNADQFGEKLSEGTKAMLKKYPGFRVDVYPTHRTVAFPSWVTENTVKAATTAHTTNDGLSLGGVRAAFPFPIPKSGREAMWNYLVRYVGTCYDARISGYYVEASGRSTLMMSAQMLTEFPYWNPKSTSNTFERVRMNYDGPPRRIGEALLIVDPIDYAQTGRRAWQYMPGQRRVKLAPDLAYDTPNPSSAGAQTFDDAFMFNGKMDRFEFTLVGKKEMYVPYNNHRVVFGAKPEELFRPHFLNPDLVRWERHRVWIVDAKLKPGQRHIYSRRVFYLDEDSWIVLMSDQYDGHGQLYRAGTGFLLQSPEVPAPFADAYLHYDLISGVYALNGWPGASGKVTYGACKGDNEWSPDALAAAGIR